jgi:hypothetical protein
LDHGAYTANGIASYVSSSSDAAGQHAHGSILNVIRDEARHFRYMQLGIGIQENNRKAKVKKCDMLKSRKDQRAKRSKSTNRPK